MWTNRPEFPLSGPGFSFKGTLAPVKQKSREAGLALLEVIVALALITATVLAVGTNVVSVAQGHRVSSNYTIAVNLAQQKMEEAKARGPLANGVATDYPAGSSGMTFIRTVEIRDVSFSKSLGNSGDSIQQLTSRGGNGVGADICHSMAQGFA